MLGGGIAGTLAWKAPAAIFDRLGEHEATWVFTPGDAGVYEPVEGTEVITVRPNVYTCGWSWSLNGGADVAKVWKNGKLLYDLPGGYGAYSLVVSGGNVYTCGNGVTSGVSVAKVWKNGDLLYDLSGGYTARSLVVSDGNVYTCGNYWNFSGGVSKVWKNGELLYNLTSGNGRAEATSLAVSDGNIYTCVPKWIESMLPVLSEVWKNDKLLFTMKENAYCLSIFIEEEL